MEFKDYYATLGVAKTATDDEIKRAYRKLARKYHPDLNPGDKTAEAKFKEINEANEVLADPEKRRKYDELGANWRMYEHAPPGGRQPGAGWSAGFGGERGGTYQTLTPEQMEQLFGGADPFSDFFHTFFSGGGAAAEGGARRGRSARPRKGQDVEYAMDLGLDEAFTGTTRRLSSSRKSGEPVEVRIPAGIKDGARVRVAGEGGAAPAGGPTGDLYLTVRVLPHARFERRGQDLYTRVAVPLTSAVLGGEVSVPTLAGTTLRLKIPELTSSGRVFRLRGHGMPAVGKPDERGDLYATVDIYVPSALSLEEREHYEALKKLAEKATGQ